jgi:oxygen-independent coproporphyrinogen-3 oxidase
MTVSATTNIEGLALYVHIPFCETKCPYCDFNTYAGIEMLMPSYVNTLIHEIEQWGALLGKPVLSTVFFGGGTPSFLPTRDLTRLTHAIGRSFALGEDGIREGVEMTLEANPGDMARERVRAMRQSGFNRISIGVQSLDDEELRLLGRRHTAEEAKQAVAAARKAGFANLSIDLIFGLPYQFVSTWAHTLEQALELEPDHLSLYGLTLEPSTPMEADVRTGRLPEPDADMAAEMYLLAQRTLADAGYRQYEISNWARPGYESTHNLTYWQSGPYLGVGPGAHSYLHGRSSLNGLGAHGMRFATIRPPRGYIDQVNAWHPSPNANLREIIETTGFMESIEAIDQPTAMAEVMMMGLRLNDGVPDAAFRRRFGMSIVSAFPEAVAECLELGLLGWNEDESLRLTEYGRLLGNEAFQRFVAPVR